MAVIQDESGKSIQDESGAEIQDESRGGTRAGAITPAGTPQRLLAVQRTDTGSL